MNPEFVITGITEADYPEFYGTLQGLMKKYELHDIRIIIKPGYKNASAVGKTIKIDDMFIKNFSKDELEGILAHEFSHMYLQHPLTMLVLNILFYIPFFWTVITFKPNNIASAIFIFISMFIIIYWFRIRNWILLHLEINADILAVYHTKNPMALQSALIKMKIAKLTSQRSRLSSLKNGFLWLVSYLFGFTHPEIIARIQYLDIAAKMVSTN